MLGVLYFYHMLTPLDNFFAQQPEPAKSCMEYLRAYIIKQSPYITEEWKYGLPFYYYNGKMFCYLWTHKKYKQYNIILLLKSAFIVEITPHL
jgi:hypothetical protein